MTSMHQQPSQEGLVTVEPVGWRQRVRYKVEEEKKEEIEIDFSRGMRAS